MNFDKTFTKIPRILVSVHRNLGNSTYTMSKESCPVLHSKGLHINGHDFLDIQFSKSRAQASSTYFNILVFITFVQA